MSYMRILGYIIWALCAVAAFSEGQMWEGVLWVWSGILNYLLATQRQENKILLQAHEELVEEYDDLYKEYDVLYDELENSTKQLINDDSPCGTVNEEE